MRHSDSCSEPKNLGKDLSRYRGSAEALLRRVLSGKGMYKINTVVDINNLVSLKTFHPIGSYDLEKIKAPLTFRAGRPGESYKGIGKEVINVEQLPCSPTLKELMVAQPAIQNGR